MIDIHGSLLPCNIHLNCCSGTHLSKNLWTTPGNWKQSGLVHSQKEQSESLHIGSAWIILTFAALPVATVGPLPRMTCCDASCFCSSWCSEGAYNPKPMIAHQYSSLVSSFASLFCSIKIEHSQKQPQGYYCQKQPCECNQSLSSSQRDVKVQRYLFCHLQCLLIQLIVGLLHIPHSRSGSVENNCNFPLG